MLHVPRFVAPLALALVLGLLLAAASADAREPRKATTAPGNVPGELLVRFKSSVAASSRREALNRIGMKGERVLRKLSARVVKVDPVNQQLALKRLRNDPRVLYAEPNARYEALQIPNDTHFGQLWGLRNTGQTITVDGYSTTGKADADIDADEAWDVTMGSRSIVVAVIDTGVDFSHPDLGGSATAANPLMWTNPGETGGGRETNRVDDDGNGYVDDWRGWDFVNDDNNPFDDESHGTHVTGTIAAKAGNGLGVAGVAPNVRIMALKFLAYDGYGETADAAEAVAYAATMGAHVSNNSWGGGGLSETLLDAIELADARRSLFVAAAGNATYDNDSEPSYPASYDVPNVISVAGSSQKDELASFTNTGKRSVDLAAPGENIYSTLPGGGYEHWDGTSMATPHVVGAAALAKSVAPAATASGLKALLLSTVDPLALLQGFMATGGRLNAAKAVRCSAQPHVWVEKPAADFTVAVGEPVQVQVHAGICGVPGGTVTATAGGLTIPLSARGDGLYSGTWTPTATGSATVVVTGTAGALSDSVTVNGTSVDNWRIVEEPFAWIDATLGTKLNALGDDEMRTVNLPFDFTYDGQTLREVAISSNGLLDFGDNDLAEWSINTGIPNTEQPNGIAAVYWDDLDPSFAGGVWRRTVGTAPNRKFVVAWVGVPRWTDPGTTDGLTFEIVLEEATGEIVMQYRDVVGGDANTDYGASATVGVESHDGWIGREFLRNEAKLRGYEGTKALRFKRGAPADTTAPDTTLLSGPSATTTRTDATFTFSANEVVPGFECRLEGGSGVWEGCTSPKSYTALQPGPHTFEVRARDAAGNVDSSPAEHRWSVEVFDAGLLPNGSFEGSLAGWRGWNAGLAIVEGDVGSDAARATATASPYGLVTPARTVPVLAAGEQYRATALVRGAAPGKTVCLAIREWNAEANAIVGSARSCAPTTNAWAQLPEVHYTTALGGSSLDVLIWQSAGAAGETFDVDGVALFGPPYSPGLLANGSFEASSSGWSAVGSTFAYAPGFVGARALRVAPTGGATLYGLVTAPRPVAPVQVGAGYSATAQVRSEATSVTVCIAIREWAADGRSIVGSAKKCVAAGSAWQPLPAASYRATTERASLDVLVWRSNGRTGESFDVDAVRLVGP